MLAQQRQARVHNIAELVCVGLPAAASRVAVTTAKAKADVQLGIQLVNDEI